MSERRACQVTGQLRATQRYVPRAAPEEPALIARIVALATRFGRYGYRRITALLRQEGWRVNHKRVERLWRQEGLRVPAKQPQRGRFWLADGSLMRRRAERPHHVWSDDSVFDRTADGRRLRILAIVDEYTRECLSLDVARRLRSDDVLARLAQLFVERGPPTYLRSDNGPEFTASAVRDWLHRVGVPPTSSSSPAVPRSTAMWNPSTASSATSASTANASTRCWKPRSSSKAGGGSTTRSAPTVPSATVPPPRKRGRSDLPPPPPGQNRRVPALT